MTTNVHVAISSLGRYRVKTTILDITSTCTLGEEIFFSLRLYVGQQCKAIVNSSFNGVSETEYTKQVKVTGSYDRVELSCEDKRVSLADFFEIRS